MRNPTGPSALVLTGLVLAATALPAGAEDRPFYTTDWTVGAPLTAAPFAPAARPAADGFMAVAQGEVFLASRLLPPGAARLLGDARDDKGKVLLPAGTELFGLRIKQGRVYCSVEQRNPSMMPSMLFGSKGFGHTCLIDGDSDGAFEATFTAKGQIKGLPNFQSRMPKNPKPVAPLRYETIDPAAMQTVYFVGVEYRANNNLGGNEVFDLVYGTAEKRGKLTARMLIKGKSVPASLEVMGGRFTLRGSANDVAAIRVDRSFPAQPFGVVQTVTFRYY